MSCSHPRFPQLALFLLIVIPFAFASGPAGNEPGKPLQDQSVSGLVRDIACPIQNPQASARIFNKDCALECARRGSPLVIQTDEGILYLPISDTMPDTDQRSKLMPFVGKYVRARGDVYERKGTRAIVIKEIKEDLTVKLQTDAK